MKAKDIRKGAVIIYNNAPYQVVDFQHRTPGNLRAFVQAKIRNLVSGALADTRFSSTEDIPEADVYLFSATFLYGDNNGFHFMNSETYEETVLSAELVGDYKYFLQDSMKVEISTYNGDPIGVKLPKTVVLTVTETDPELKGATASNSYKPAKLDTGLDITVPPFIKRGEKIMVDVEERKYLSRADSN